ncbi:MAG: hypothetical protein V1686_01380 [Patescibacteria group bacterium]
MKKTKKAIKKVVKKIVKKPVKKVVKKVAKKAVKKAVKKVIKEEGQLIGKIIHYYDHIEVGIIELNKGALEVGNKIRVKGNVTDFEQDIISMQINHEQINKAKKGDVVGLKVKEKSREGDLVYKV